VSRSEIGCDSQAPRLNVMHIADVTGRGGAEKVLVDLALGLDSARFSVSVCATRSAGNYQPVLDQAGVPTFVLGRRSTWELTNVEGIPYRYRKVVYNGVDMEQIVPHHDGPQVRRELGIPMEAVVIGTLGRLSPDRDGQDYLFKP